MAGRWVPAGYLALEPWWRNLFENIAAVQFNHRLLALTTLAAVAWLWAQALRRAAGPARRLAHLALAAAAAQVALGIATLLSKVAIPLASAHQATALVLLTLLLALRHALGPGSFRCMAPPLGGMAPLPLRALATSVSTPWAMRSFHAFLSPSLGAPAAPVEWHAKQFAS